MPTKQLPLIPDREPDRRIYATEFWALPQEQWRPFSDAGEDGLGPCACPYCSPERGESRRVAAWDTVARDSKTGKVWTCHFPELRRVKRKRKGA